MDFSKLNALGTDTLQAMQTHIGTLLAGRLDSRPLPGRTATFIGKLGFRISCRIDQMNRTTVSVTETDPQPGRKWRVSPSMLTVVPEVRKNPIVPVTKAQPAAHRPTTTVGDSW